MAEKPPVKSYCGGKPNYCTPEETRDNSSWVGLTTAEVIQCQAAYYYDTYANIEDKLKEKNNA